MIRRVQIKEKKAIDASYSAMASVERAMEKKLEFQKNQKALHAVRHIHWFEKFNWFITSEGYLVISGRDAAQTEQIALRYTCVLRTFSSTRTVRAPFLVCSGTNQ